VFGGEVRLDFVGELLTLQTKRRVDLNVKIFCVIGEEELSTELVNTFNLVLDYGQKFGFFLV